MDESRGKNGGTVPLFTQDVTTLLDHLEEGVIVLDAAHRVLFRSHKCCSQYGLSEDATTLEELIDTEALGSWQRAIELGRQEASFRTVLPHAANGFIRLHIAAHTNGNIVISLRPAEAPVDQDELLGAYERVLAKFDIGLWKVHAASGELWWSDKCYELLGIEPGPVCTSSYLKDLSPEDQNRISSHINLALSQKGQYAPRFKVQRQDGVRHVQDRASVLQRDKDGTPLSFVGATVDRTQLVELEQQCEALKGKIDEAEALRQTGRLTGAVAHDLNNVMTVILGNAELMRVEDLDPRLMECATNIYTAALHAGTLSSRMLDFVRDTPIAMASVDAVQIIEDSKPLLRALVSENTELVFTPSPEEALVMGDRHRLERALYNLVLNAGQAVAAGGRITIGLELDTDVVRFCVSDDGPGIDQAVRDQMFSPFFSTKETGVGLGLPSVKRVADQHSGYVDVSTPEGGGARFAIAIPRSFTEPVRARANTPDTAGADRQIWIVEDQLLVRVVTEKLLIQASYQVRAFAEPARLLQALAAGEGPPDLVLSDVMMPTMSGPELRDQLQKQLPGLRFVFMTGYADDLLAPIADSLDRRSLLHKPFHRTELLRAIGEALAA